MDKSFLNFLPSKILVDILNFESLEEIRIRINKRVYLKYFGFEKFLDYKITKKEFDEILDDMFLCSRYSYQDEIINGFITIEGGHRVGITGNVVCKNNKIININNINSLNIRIARVAKGVSVLVDRYIVKNNMICNTLIVSIPGQGKTTILKDLIRRISDGDINSLDKSLTVGVVDERMEIAANFNGENQTDLGEKTDVISNVSKDLGMKMLIRSMAPQVLVVDEIGTKEDVEAIKYAVTSGVKGIFTAHGDSLNNILLNPILKELLNSSLIERIIFLSKEKKCEIDSVYENTKEGYIKYAGN